MKACVLLLVLVGCYGDFRVGGTAPTNHGHGGGGFDLEAAGGAQYRSDTVEIGAGPKTGVHVVDAPPGEAKATSDGYVPFGIEGRLVVALAPLAPHSSRQMFLVTHASAAATVALNKTASDAMAMSGRETSFFAGLGITAANNANNRISFGLSGSRFWPDAGEPYWLLGAALEFSLSADSD